MCPAARAQLLQAPPTCPPHLAQTCSSAAQHSHGGLLSPESTLLPSSMESLSVNSGGGGNGGGGGVIRTGGTWGWTDLVSGNSGESRLTSVPAMLDKHRGPNGAWAAQRGPEEKYARGNRTLSLLCLPAYPCRVAGFSNSLYPPISSSGSPEQPSFSPTQMGVCTHAGTHVSL